MTGYRARAGRLILRAAPRLREADGTVAMSYAHGHRLGDVVVLSGLFAGDDRVTIVGTSPTSFLWVRHLSSRERVVVWAAAWVEHGTVDRRRAAIYLGLTVLVLAAIGSAR